MRPIPHLDLPPLDAVAGRVRLPGSKSISNRLLLLAALADGATTLHDVLDSDDTRVMVRALGALGCRIEPLDGGRTLVVHGLGGRPSVREASLHLGNAGTAMRPLAAALAMVALRDGGRYVLDGVARMRERPIGDLGDALAALGCRVEWLGTPGFPPLAVGAPQAPQGTMPETIDVRGDVSSQFLTALLLALPLLSQPSGPARTVRVVGELISKPYVEITLRLLERFGVAFERDGWRAFTLVPGAAYRSPGSVHVESDASSASYFVAAGAIAARDAPLVVEGVGTASIQGDIAFVDAARAMGARVDAEPNRLVVRSGGLPLRAVDVDAVAIPDAAMTLAAMALFADGTTRLRGIGSWRVKETDRIAAIADGCRRLGARVDAGDDWIAITPPAPGAWRAATIETHDDHRIAMCFALAAFNPLAGAAGGAGVPVRIVDPRCVAKTFPDFFETFAAVAGARPGAIPVITIDGPTASGKGTLSAALAGRLGWHRLDSGAIYRAAALAALRTGTDLDDGAALARLAAGLALAFDGERVVLDGDDVGDALRREDVGVAASRLSAHPAVRAALHGLQLAFRRVPGLVADGRDMGTVVFADAALKVYLTAGAAERAERRHKQLISKGFSSNLAALRGELEARDARDVQRAVAPLRPAADARLLDNSALGIDESVERVLGWWEARRPFAAERAGNAE